MKRRTKKMWKRSVSLLLVCAMVLSSPAADNGLLKGLFPELSQKAAAAEGQIPDDTALDASVIPDDVLLAYLKQVLGGSNPTVKDLASYEGELEVPSGVQNLKGLGYARNASLFDLSACTSVTEIAASEFNACAMTQVKLPASLTKLGDNAFKECSQLATINLDNVTSIGKFAFTGCSVLSDASFASMKKSLSYLGEGAFSSCIALTQAFVPVISDSELAHTVPKQLFEGCNQLEKVAFFDTSVQYIMDKAFERTGNLQFCVGDVSTGVASGYSNQLPSCFGYIMESAFSNSKIKSIDLSATGVTVLENSTFYQADLSEGVILPAELREIEEQVFARSQITEIDMPNTVTKIGKYCFDYTPKLENLVLSQALTTIPEGAFRGAGAVNIVAGDESADYNNDQANDGFSTDLTVSYHGGTPADSNLKTIENQAFYLSTVGYEDDSFLSGLTKLKTIGVKAFSYTDFTTLTIPSCVTTIGAQAFNGMYYMEEVIFADGSQVKELPEQCFGSINEETNSLTYADYCLKQVQLPENLEKIGAYCFSNCVQLKTVGYRGTMAEGEVIFPETLTSIGEYAFNRCATFSVEGITEYFGFEQVSNTGIEKVTIPDAVTTIGEAAFKECILLSELKVGNGVTQIPAEMCSGCGAYPTDEDEEDYLLPTSSPEVTSNPNLTEKDYTPIEFVGLKKITLPDGITSIGEEAFYECYALEEFVNQNSEKQTNDLPLSLTEIGSSAFRECKSLTKVRFQTEIKTIGDWAFAEASQGIDEIYEPQKETYRIYHPYYGLKSVDFMFATKLESIGSNAFYETNIDKIEFPNSLTKISSGICEGCYNLTKVTMSKDVTLVENNAFTDCYRLNTITIPIAAEWEEDLFAGAAANEYKGLTVINAVETGEEEITVPIIVGREQEMPSLNCFKNFSNTALSLTDRSMLEDDEKNDLLKYNSNAYIKARQSGGQIILEGVKEGTASVKVTGKIDLFNQNLNYSHVTITISQNYGVNVTRLPITSIELQSDIIREIDGQRMIYLPYDTDPTSETMEAIFAPEDTTDSLEWEVKDTSIARVEAEEEAENGVSTAELTPLALGDTVLNVFSPTMKETCDIHVRVPARTINVPDSSITLDVGVSKTIAAEVVYDDELKADAEKYPERLLYSSDDESVVTVDSNTGAIKTISEGTATITVLGLASDRQTTYRVTVEAGYVPPVKSVTVSESEATMNVGEQKVLTATVLPAEAKQTLSWSSDDEKIATVANGVVTALRAGSVTITVTGSDNKTDSCKITVKSPAKGLKIRGTNGSTKKIVVKKGTTTTLSKFFTNDDCTDEFKFTAKKSKAGTVSESGEVTTKKPGKIVVTLTAYDGDTVNAKAKFTVQVVKKNKKAKKIKVKGPKSVLVDNRICLSATTKPGNATSTVTWISSNTSIATVDEYGVVTGLKPGKVKITAKANGKKKKVTIKVK